MSASDFSLQYHLTYIQRFNQFKELIIQNPAFNEYNLPLMNLSDDLNSECIIIAILFLDSKNKISILRDGDSIKENYLENHQFYIEDNKSRILISFNDSFSKLVSFSTGMVLGFVGSKNEKNVFECSDVIFPAPLVSNSHFKAENVVSKGANKILFLSNIVVNENYEKVKMAFDYCSESVKEIVVFGNLCTNSESLPDLNDFHQIFKNENVKIHIVPGLKDFNSSIIPANPLHKMLFDSKVLKDIDLLPHPSNCKINNQNFIFLNNFVVDNLMKYAVKDCSISEITKQLLKIRYLAPNAPDTLISAPMSQKDPFFIRECDYFVVGGTPSFIRDNYKGVEMFTVPDFNLTNSAIILDLESKSLEEFVFDLPEKL